jgi:hypothetical protein
MTIAQGSHVLQLAIAKTQLHHQLVRAKVIDPFGNFSADAVAVNHPIAPAIAVTYWFGKVLDAARFAAFGDDAGHAVTCANNSIATAHIGFSLSWCADQCGAEKSDAEYALQDIDRHCIQAPTPDGYIDMSYFAVLGFYL